MIAAGSYDGTIQLIKVSKETVVEKCISLNKCSLIPNKVELSAQGRRLLVGLKNAVRIYDLHENQQVLSIDNNFKGNVTAIGFLRNDKNEQSQNVFFAGCEDGMLKILDQRDPNSVVATMPHKKPINTAVMHTTTFDIFSGDEAGFFRIWDLRKYQEHVWIVGENEVGIRSIAVSKTGNAICFADAKGYLNTFGQHLVKGRSFQPHKDYILKVDISPNGKYLATSSADKFIKLFKVTQQGGKCELQKFKTLEGHKKWVWDCLFTSDSLLSCSTDGYIRLWSMETGESLEIIKKHKMGFICMAASQTL